MVAAKIEYLNPGGSAKDRIAIKMIDAAEASGELKPGGTIVEPTSGNTGVGLALVAQHRGYRCIFVCPTRSVRTSKMCCAPTALRWWCARRPYRPTILTATTASPTGWSRDRRRMKARPVLQPDGSGKSLRDHRPEIWADTDGKVTHFVAGVGTGGTITGAGRYLKEVSGGKVQIVGVDPEGLVYSGGTGRPYLVEGVGEDFWPCLRPARAGRDHRGLRRRLLRDDLPPRA